MHKLILTVFIFFLISCSSNDTTDLASEQSLYDNNIYDDYELFNRANNFIKTNQLNLALIELDKIEVLFPSSAYASKGMLVSSYINFLKKDYEKTRAIAESYKNYYPGSKDIVYANYLEAMTYYVLIKKPDYSQKNAYNALEKFNFILNAFPNSKYEIDIITKIKIIDNNLAAHKLSTAKFYMNKNNYDAALVYLKDIFINYNSTLLIEETLFYLVKIYNSLEEPEVAKKYAAILAYNFPNSMWYERSYNLINDIEIKSDNKSWFNRFNPIKLLISDEEEEQLTIQTIE